MICQELIIISGHEQVGDQSENAIGENQLLSAEAQQWLRDVFPERYPTVPSL